MAVVLLTWELGGGLGHCVKLAPLAAGLVARGPDVYFAARDVATAQKVLQNPAVKYLQSPCLVARPANVLQRPRSFSQVLDQVGFGDDGQLRALVGSWRSLLELVRPTLNETDVASRRGTDQLPTTGLKTSLLATFDECVPFVTVYADYAFTYRLIYDLPRNRRDLCVSFLALGRQRLHRTD